MELLLVYPIIIFSCYPILTVVSIGDCTFSSLSEQTEEDFTDWCYDEPTCGEESWIGSCGYNTHQSPIDLPGNLKHLHTREIIKKFPKSKLTFSGFDIAFKGHTFHIRPTGKTFSFLRTMASGHSVNYTLYALDFHWGKTNNIGSEHTINKISYSGEVHLAFFDPNKFIPAKETRENKYNLQDILVIGILLDVDETGMQEETSEFLKAIVENLPALENANRSIKVNESKLDLQHLFRGNLTYRYPGSFTTPNCREAEWWVMRKPVLVPGKHLQAFRDARINGIRVDGNNFRSLNTKRLEDITLLQLNYT